MALASTYVLPPPDELAESYMLPRPDELAESYDNVLFRGKAGARLGGLRVLRGRQGVAIPSGVVLREATGGTPPYTYAMSNLPAGVNFTAGTRTLSGTPSAAGDFTPTYTATDADGGAASKNFTYEVLSSSLGTDPTAISDFNGGQIGYGLLDPVYALAVVSGNDVGSSGNITIWQRTPRNLTGQTVDDPLTKQGIPTGGIISRFMFRNPSTFRIYDSDVDVNLNPEPAHIGNWVTDVDNASLDMYLQVGSGAPDVMSSFGDASAVGDYAAHFALTDTERDWCRSNLDNGEQFIMVIS